MPPPTYRPHQLRGQAFRGTQAIDAGALTPNQLRSNAWVRLCHDVYADSRLERTHLLTCHAFALRLPPECVFAGPSAAVVHGIDHAARYRDPVHVIAPSQLRISPMAGLRVHTVAVEPSDVRAAGMRLTHPIRTAWDLAAWLDAPQAVAIIDAMVASRLLDHHEAMAFAASRRGRRWHRRVSRVFELVDGRAQSPPESHLRVQLMTAGLPRPTPQLAVPVPGLVLHPDLAWPEWKVAVEYVGRWHHQEEQFHRDRRRLNLLVADGWLVLHVTHDRLRSDTAGMVREIRAALTARGWRGWRG